MSLAETALSAAVPLAVNSITRTPEPVILDDEGLERAFVEAQMAVNRNAYAVPKDGFEALLLFGLVGLLAGFYVTKKVH